MDFYFIFSLIIHLGPNFFFSTIPTPDYDLEVKVMDLEIYVKVFASKFLSSLNYTPDIRSIWGYIVFAFPFIRSFVRTYVRTFVRTFVRLSVTGSKFLR